jgi:hypothetical protein
MGVEVFSAKQDSSAFGKTTLSVFGGINLSLYLYCYVTQESVIEAVIHTCQAFMHNVAHTTNVWMLHQVP